MFDTEHPRYKEASEFRSLIETDPDAKTVFDRALGLEGLKRQWGVHAAGVIMSSEPLLDIIPIMRREQDGQIVTQFDYPSCEALGLIKMDFLGLRNLTIISDALDNIRMNRGEELDLEHLTLDDRPAYDLLTRGRHARRLPARRRPDACAAAPDEAGQLRGHLRRHRAVPSRPDGRELAHQLRAAQERSAADHPIHPELEEPLRDILDTTYGLIIYQEQVMAIAQKVAGFSSDRPTSCAARWARRRSPSSTSSTRASPAA
jgi:DNA polymerase-3 subunit alpha